MRLVFEQIRSGGDRNFGYLLGDLRGASPAERLRLAVAYGSAAAALPGTTIPTPTHISPELVDVRQLALAGN